MSQFETRPAAARGIDPRAPRFAAGITAVVLLVAVFLGLVAPLAGLIVLAAQTVVFAIGAFGGIRRGPYGIVFRALVRPRLAPPTELEDPAPPTFSQVVGFVVAGVGVVLGLVGLTWAVPLFGAFAFVAAFLNAVFGYCLGCQLYLLGVRAGVLGRARRSA